MVRRKTFRIVSLGCFRNTYDSGLIAGALIGNGYTQKEGCGSVHTLIINTCGFIRDAKKESLDAIADALELKKQGRIRRVEVRGCLVQRYGRELTRHFPGVDRWQGIEPLPAKAAPRENIMPPWIDFLKISEGCSHRCSYCAIPLIKGPLASRPAEDLVEETARIDARGVKELNVIGQDTTAWGQDIYKKRDLAFLLRKIARTCRTIRWIRVLYTHPDNFSDALIETIAHEPRICKYVDLPLQHISDRILKSMGRRAGRQRITALIRKIRRRIPGCVIRTSLITGFPGETENDFHEMRAFLREFRFERAGVFIYSREEGTPAFHYKAQVPYQTKRRRYNELMKVQQEISRDTQKRFLGMPMEVLAEEQAGDVTVCRSRYHCHDVDGVVFVTRKGLTPGRFYKSTITGAYEYDLVGK